MPPTYHWQHHDTSYKWETYNYGHIASRQRVYACWSDYIPSLQPQKYSFLRVVLPPFEQIKIFTLIYTNNTFWTFIDQLEAIQKRALRIVYPDLHYQQALAQANITSLEDRRAHLCLKVWHNIKNNPDGQLHRLLPPVRSECHSYHLRNSSSSSRFQYRTKRFGSSFFPAMAKIN